MSISSSLKNHFLIAMPELEASFFGGTVTYLCNHDEHGAMGLVINQRADVSAEEIFDDLNIDYLNHALLPDILAGGPVDLNRGFVLHSSESVWKSTMQVTAEVYLTTSADILKAIANGTGPERYLLALGYAGWGPGQLEQELLENAWLTAPGDLFTLFDCPLELRVKHVTKQLGVDIHLMGPHGHA
jgi:putative transcriptional regulator